MKKLFFSLLAAAMMLPAFADGVDVSASYIGDKGWINTQTLSGYHAFVAPVGKVGESWTPGIGTAGVMLGYNAVLPQGNYTLSFEAFGCTASNASDQTLPTAGDVVAFCANMDVVDITNTSSLGENTFHPVSFTFDVTSPNSVIQFGVKKVTDESKPDWCQMQNVKIVLNSTNITPVANNSIDGYDYGTLPDGEKFQVNTWSIEGQSDGTYFQVPFIENWIANGKVLGNKTIKRSFSPTQSGVYKVTAWVRAISEAGNAVSGAKIFVGNVEADACGGASVFNNKGRLGTFTAMADGVSGTAFDYGFKIQGATFNWLSFKNITIEYVGAGLPDADVDALLATVPTGKMDATIQTNLNSYVTALQTNKSVSAYNTLAAYIPTATASINAYAAAKAIAEPAKVKADASGFDISTEWNTFDTKYNNGSLNGNTEANAVKDAYITQLCTEVNGISTNYPNSSDQVLNTDISKWTTSTYTVMNNAEHWSGVNPTKYYEQSSAQWGATSWDIAAEQSVNLPVGHYAFVVTARGMSGITSTLTVDGKTQSLSTVGSVGRGIAKNGTATYSDAAQYARDDNSGYGWEYAMVKFEVTSAKNVTFKLEASATTNHMWVSIANPVLYYQDDAKEAMEIIAARAKLNNLLLNVSEIPSSLIGTDAFLYSTADATAYNDKITTAQGVADNNGATLSQINAQIDIIESLTLPTLNAPSSTQAYKIVLKYAGWDYDNCAITARANDRGDQGNYNLKYAAKNANYAQAFFFDAVAGVADTYKVRFTDAEGQDRYICTKKAYGETKKADFNSIRTTTIEADALPIKVERVEEVLRLYNTQNEAYIGSQDAGVYTVASHNDYVVEETTAKNTVERTVASGKYATIVLPFAATATAYSASVEGEYVVLTAVTALEANKAYIIGAGNHSYEGVSVAFEEPGANGALTGIYKDTKVPVDAYVLQTKDGVQEFHKVVSGHQPTLSANKAYLTAASNAPIYRIAGESTGIDAIDALVNGEAQIFDMNGRKLNSLQKGINIVNGVKVIVK